MTHFIGGNHLKLLRNGEEYFPALEAAIQHAKHEIYLETTFTKKTSLAAVLAMH